jgi:hypothetical protein
MGPARHRVRTWTHHGFSIMNCLQGRKTKTWGVEGGGARSQGGRGTGKSVRRCRGAHRKRTGMRTWAVRQRPNPKRTIFQSHMRATASAHPPTYWTWLVSSLIGVAEGGGGGFVSPCASKFSSQMWVPNLGPIVVAPAALQYGSYVPFLSLHALLASMFGWATSRIRSDVPRGAHCAFDSPRPHHLPHCGAHAHTARPARACSQTLAPFPQ